MTGMKLLRSALVAGIALACILPAAAGELKVVAFAGASNWPFWIGQEKGVFKKNGVEPTLDITPNSAQLAKDLFAGKYDLAMTAIDNIIAYTEGQGEADGLPPNAGFAAIFGIDDGMLNVIAKPELKSLDDLKGKTFSVDAMTTGYAFVQRELLVRHGLKEDDVKWVKVGGGAQRLEALLKGEQDATLLNTPLDLAAEAKGFRRLVRAKDELGAYQGIVGAVKRENAPAKRAEIVSYIRGFRESVAWLVDPANKEEALAIFLSRSKGMERPAAEKAYIALTAANGGIYRDLQISAEGLKTVMSLRSKYAEPKKALTDPSRYVDASYLNEAGK
jgi:ABC-type nitrate/sulfonate/bicarbonate transport system substrate-binding protein